MQVMHTWGLDVEQKEHPGSQAARVFDDGGSENSVYPIGLTKAKH